MQTQEIVAITPRYKGVQSNQNLRCHHRPYESAAACLELYIPYVCSSSAVVEGGQAR